MEEPGADKETSATILLTRGDHRFVSFNLPSLTGWMIFNSKDLLQVTDMPAAGQILADMTKSIHGQDKVDTFLKVMI